MSIAVRAPAVLLAAALALAPDGHARGAAPANAKAEIVPASVVQVLSAVKKPGARAVLLNVWATWCDPCREEMPDLVRIYREHKAQGLRLVLVSTDGRDEKADAEKFLADQGVDFVSFLKTDKDMEFIDGIDKRWNGTLPASFLYDGQGKTVHFWSGKVSYQALKQKLDDVLKPKANPKTKK
jgi:thiol-disulfide isomerase/thioredoxin